MSRPPTYTLGNLTPGGVALLACERVARHLQSYAIRLAPAADMRCPEPIQLAAGSDFGLTIAQLTDYAQTGVAGGDWKDHEDAADALLRVLPLLYGSACGEKIILFDESDHGFLEAIDVVLLSVWARVQIARGEPVSIKSLALLGGVTKQWIQFQVERGEIEVQRSGRKISISAIAAKEWLARRSA